MPLVAKVKSCELHYEFHSRWEPDGYKPVTAARTVSERLKCFVRDLEDLSFVSVDEEEVPSVKGMFHVLPV